MEFIRRLRSALFIGLLILCAGSLLIATASQTTVLTAEEDLSHYWRTTYDILVRPKDSRSQIEKTYGLVEANSLSGIWGGITFAQYEEIKSIPSVDIAAPIAMLGYIPVFFDAGSPLGQISQPSLYVFNETIASNSGEHVYSGGYTYLYTTEGSQYAALSGQNHFMITPPVGTYITDVFPISVLLAGIDSQQEAKLIGLDKTMVQGEYLNSGVESHLVDTPFGPKLIMPVLFNITPYIQVTFHSDLKLLASPPDPRDIGKIIDSQGMNYLASLPGDILGVQDLDTEGFYHRLADIVLSKEGFAPGVTGSTPSQITYQVIQPSFYKDLALEIVLPNNWATTPDLPPGEYAYRSFLDPGSAAAWFNIKYLQLDGQGLFKIENLPKPSEVNQVPLETYFPPVGILRYDEQGNPINPPVELHPTISPAGYIQSPPLLLTTMEAANTLRGDTAISAIRVRVTLDGCPPEHPQTCTLNAADQRKIEAIAIQIQRQTGLDVDIMVGSSPRRILVHVPGIGYVEEQWIQKGVNLVYKQGIQTGSWLLLGTLLVAGGLFTLDLTWADVVARRRLIALQKALGWRSRTVFSQVMRQVVMFGAIAAIAGTLAALIAIRLLGWRFLPLGQIISLPLIVIGLCGIGSLIPAWSASRVPPITGLQRGGIRYSRKHTNPNSSLWGYAWSEIKRRQARSVLTGLASVLSAGLLTLLLGVTFQQRGMLSGTLLGEFILVRIEGFHYAIVAIGLGLAALSTFNSLMGSIFERRREIGVLKAVGWQTTLVLRLFIMQGLLLGLVGGSAGALLGSLVFIYLYQSISSSLGIAILMGISLPGLVGALAAIYPARLAAMVQPAEAVRYE